MTRTSVLRMTWVDLAFLHWPVPAASLRPLVPAALAIEEYDGSAWVGVVPFEMRDVRLHALPPIPTATNFPELNVRTYVRHAGRQGVYFFSLDAASVLAVVGARTGTGLRYYHARMRIDRDGGDVRYESHRTEDPRPAEFVARYWPTGDVFLSEQGSFEYWSTERYSLFSEWAGTLLRLDIAHPRWPLQSATAEVERNSIASVSGISLRGQAPHVLFAARQDVDAYWPSKADTD